MKRRENLSISHISNEKWGYRDLGFGEIFNGLVKIIGVRKLVSLSNKGIKGIASSRGPIGATQKRQAHEN